VSSSIENIQSICIPRSILNNNVHRSPCHDPSGTAVVLSNDVYKLNKKVTQLLVVVLAVIKRKPKD